MEPKIKVYGKAMNRTALGIVNAYLKLYPKSTVQDLKKAFPDELYPEVEGGFFKTIKPLGVFQTKEIVDSLPAQGLQQPFFMNDDEIITLADGQKICVTKSWGKNALNKLIERAREFGIVVAESTEGVAFQRGEYILEELEGFKKHNAKPKLTTTQKAVAIAATLSVLSLGGYGILHKCTTDQVVNTIKEKAIEQVKDEANGQIEDYAKEQIKEFFNSTQENRVTLYINFDVDENKPNGKSWDVNGGDPDPEIIIKIDGKEIAQLEKMDDTFYYNEIAEITIPENSKTILFEINDNDPVVTDKIGKAEFTMPKQIEFGKTYNVKSYGSLRNFKITFRK